MPQFGLNPALLRPTSSTRLCVYVQDRMSVFRGMTDASCCRLFGLPECCDRLTRDLRRNKRMQTHGYLPGRRALLEQAHALHH